LHPGYRVCGFICHAAGGTNVRRTCSARIIENTLIHDVKYLAKKFRPHISTMHTNIFDLASCLKIKITLKYRCSRIAHCKIVFYNAVLPVLLMHCGTSNHGNGLR
jgi:hypothetical protein